MKKLKKFWNWYIRGSYHCDKCPYCWSDYSPVCGDGDCGCYIKGDIQDTCRLLPPFRFLIGWPRKRKAEYFAAHEWDDYSNWVDQLEGKQEIFETALREFVDNVHMQDPSDGTQYDVEALIDRRGGSLFYQYEEAAHPFSSPPSLKRQWENVINATREAALERVRPFLPEKKRKAYCPHCHRRLRKSKNPRYDYECRRCKEDYFSFEAEEK